MTVLALAVFSALIFNHSLEDRRNATQATVLIDRVRHAEIEQLPEIVKELDDYRELVDPILRSDIDDESVPLNVRIRASIALLPTDPQQVTFLQERLLNQQTTAVELLVIRQALEPHADSLVADLWDIVKNDGDRRTRFRAACALAKLDHANDDWELIRDDVVRSYLKEPSIFAQNWLDVLRPVSELLTQQLVSIFPTLNDGDAAHNAALAIYQYNRRDVRQFVDLLLDSNDVQYRALLDFLRLSATAAAQELASRFREITSVDAQEHKVGEAKSTKDEMAADRVARKVANITLALSQLGQTKYLIDNLEYAPDPRTRTYLIHDMNPVRIDIERVLQLYSNGQTSGAAKHGLLLAVAKHLSSPMTDDTRHRLVAELRQRFRDDTHPGVHSTIEWLLQQLGEDDYLASAKKSLISASPEDSRDWYINSATQTFAVFRPNQRGVTNQNGESNQQGARPSYTFAIATKEVTLDQFMKFATAHTQTTFQDPNNESPASSMHLVMAIRYCQWLSEKEFPPSEWCYPRLKELRIGNMDPVPGYLDKKGYRLPRDVEWEFAC